MTDLPKLMREHADYMETITDFVGSPDAIARALRSGASRLEEQHTRGLELAKALSTCITAMNPPDKGGISMHEWNQRLKAATKQACAVFDGSVIAPAPEGSEND